jgi:hypothetical protein
MNQIHSIIKLFNKLTLVKFIYILIFYFKLALKLIYDLLIIFTLILLITIYLFDINIFEIISIFINHLLQLFLAENNNVITFTSNNISDFFPISCSPDNIPNNAFTSTANNTNNNTLQPLKDYFTYKAKERAKITVSPETIAKISDKIINNLPGISSTVASGTTTGAGATGAMMAANRLVKNTPLPLAAKASVSIVYQVGATVGRNINQFLESQVENSLF